MSNESKELARAILDDRMEPFNKEINSKLIRFGGHKKRLLSILAGDRPKTTTLNEDDLWSRIETTAYKYLAMQIMRLRVSRTARVSRYDAISKIAKRAATKIRKERWPDIAAHPIKEWLVGAKDLSEATDEFRGFLLLELAITGHFDNLEKDLAELEVKANEAANLVRRSRGRPKETSVLPAIYVYELADDYQVGTGHPPKSGDGPFADFVCEFLEAVGGNKGVKEDKEYVIDVIKKAFAARQKSKRFAAVR
jgi:hypothetical protein